MEQGSVLRGAAVLIPLVRGQEGPALLMEVRSLNVMQPGEICFPGGHIEDGETGSVTALREMAEELGIPPSSVRIMREMAPELHLSRMLVHPVLAEIDPFEPERLVLRREEVSCVFTLPLAWLLSHEPAVYDITDPEDKRIPEKLRRYLKNYSRSGGQKITTNYWEYGPYGIWGLTARLLIRLRDSLKAEETAGAERDPVPGMAAADRSGGEVPGNEERTV